MGISIHPPSRGFVPSAWTLKVTSFFIIQYGHLHVSVDFGIHHLLPNAFESV